MRTSLTLEPDNADRLRKLAEREQVSFKRAVNDAIRTGLDVVEEKAKSRRYRVRPFRLGLKPGIDMDKINQTLAEMDAEEFLRKTSPE